MSGWNVVVAVTNIASFYPLSICYNQDDYATAICIIFAATSSFVSHLFMSHKHDMVGFGINTNESQLLDDIDIFSVLLLMIRLLGLCRIEFIPLFCPDLILLAMLNIMSEQTNNKCLYIIFHCLWHMAAFAMVGEFLIFNK
jgi:hypothetical protein